MTSNHAYTHCVDPNVAITVETEQILDFCYDCDDFVTRDDNRYPMGITIHTHCQTR